MLVQEDFLMLDWLADLKYLTPFLYVFIVSDSTSCHSFISFLYFFFWMLSKSKGPYSVQSC